MWRSEGGDPVGVPWALPSPRLRRCSPRCEGVGVSHALIHSARRSFTNTWSVPSSELGTGDQDMEQPLPLFARSGPGGALGGPG